MKYLISLYVWLVGGLCFLVLCFKVLFLSFFFKPKTIDPLIKLSLKAWFKIIFVKVRTEGTEYIQLDKTYLFMANHQSMFDVPIFEAYIPTFVRGVEALRQFKWPVYGWIVRRQGNIPIDRKNLQASIQSAKIAEEHLKKGTSILIAPEGHRTLDGNLRSFKKLPFHLAKGAEVPIIPIGLSGVFELKRKGSWIINPRTIMIKFGPPIEPEQIRNLSVEELRDLAKDRILTLIK